MDTKAHIVKEAIPTGCEERTIVGSDALDEKTS
ncbi:hypothetical protein AA0111_g4533 [Alternaria arborescens]|nr:hypothetical protein AA0111_g4533 [Alternaria arborescens]RYO32753.1 hypothetical protein AA0111_g4533 [Alternaria arborescens]